MADFVTIKADVRHLVADRPSSFLTADVAATGTTLTVKNYSQFSDNDFLLVGDLGSETSEIIQVDDASIDATVTVGALVYAHSAYDKVTVIPFNQIEFSTSSTITGTKTVLSTKGISADRFQTTYDDSSVSTGFYFYRFKETEGNTFSSYSDPIPYSGEYLYSAGYTIDYALKRNKTTLTDEITEQFMVDEINSCLRYITGKRKRWSQLQSFDQILGQTSRGVNSFSLPTDIYDSVSDKSILDIRVGTNTGLKRRDKKEFEDLMEGVSHTQVTTQAEIGDTTLAIDNSYDFNDTGTVTFYISGTKYEVTYTAVTRSATAGVLTGVPASGDGSITVQIPVDTDVWDGIDEGTPMYFTVYGGKVYIYNSPDAQHDNMNVYIDYWTAPTEVDSRGDTLDVFRFDMVKFWLTWAVRSQIKNDGMRTFEDADYVMFERMLKDAQKTERSMQKFKSPPKINGITYG